VDYEKYHQYVGLARAKHTVSLQATRGCPYNCCYCHKIGPKKHVMRSAGHIFQEVHSCYEAGVRRFSFMDDIFNLHEKNSGELLQKIIKHSLNVQLYFPNGLRGDILSKDFIDLMIEAGTVEINLALETASPRLQKLLGKNLDLEKFQENVFYTAGTYPRVILDLEMMMGFPTETETEALQTLEMLKSFKWIHFPGLNVLKIYPNTEMYRFSIEQGVSKKSIEISTNLGYQDLPETLPFSKNFARQYQAKFMKEYFLLKERLIQVLPIQMQTATEDELVQKYDSYLPLDIKKFSDILHFAGISKEELGGVEPRTVEYKAAPGFNQKIKKFFPVKESDDDAFKILLLDLSLPFSRDSHFFYDMIEEPLGLMALLTYLDRAFTHGIRGKVAKSRIDFDRYEELRALIHDFKPDLIGIRTLSYYKEFFHKTVLLIRQWGFKGTIAAGGPYATSDYKLLLQDEGVDLVVLGEGELTLAELVEKMIENHHQLPGEEIVSQIWGIAFVKSKDKFNRLPRQKSRGIVLLDEMALSGELAKYPVENLENRSPADAPLYVIYTSGSTGSPKGVVLEQRNLANLIYYQYKDTAIDFSGVLQFTTISFDVSAQEIFSTLLAGGRLFLINKEILNDITGLFRMVEKNNIRTLFLPASFLKFVTNEADYVKQLPKGIKHIITAGDQPVINLPFKNYLQENNVYFHNHYGPSETHVVTTLTVEPRTGIPGVPSIGRPVFNTGIYILDKNKKLLPIGVTGQLYIGGAQVGRGYLNRPELTNEKFCPRRARGAGTLLGVSSMSSMSHMSYLYQTGDLARWLEDGNIEFLGRTDHQVKIRGFRVEPGEIERHLLAHEKIKDALVTVKTDKNNNKSLCAYVVAHKEVGVSELRAFLSHGLPDYMIPTNFVPLESIPLTPNRKVDREALPEPGIEVGEGYIAPRNEIEHKMIEIWSEVLMVEKRLMSIDSNFFDLGGHSLKATILISKIHKIFQVNVPLAELFKTPNIRRLSQYIGGQKQYYFSSLQPVEEREYYALSPGQKRLYMLQQMDLTSTTYNLPAALVLEGQWDIKKLEYTFSELVKRHESFRTSFRIVNGVPVQIIYGHMEFEIQYSDLQVTGAGISSFIRPFDLSQMPLLRVGLMKLPHTPSPLRGHSRRGTYNSQEGNYGEEHLLIVDMHHIITDGTSMDSFIKEFMALYAGEKLPLLKFQYKDYARWQTGDSQKKAIKKQEKYWLRQFTDEVPVLNMPLDYPRPAIQSFAGNILWFELPVESTRALNQLALETGATLYMVLLAIFNVFLSKISGQEDIVVGTPTAARRHADLERIIGMFVNTLAMRNSPVGNQTFNDFLTKLKIRTLQAFENQEYPFEDLVEKISVNRDPGRNPIFDTLFALQNLETQNHEIVFEDISQLRIKPYEIETGVSKFDFSLTCRETEERLVCSFEYCIKLFKKETMRRFINYFQQVVSLVIKDRNRKISQVEIITKEEKKKILYDFNDTAVSYPKEKTIWQLFKEQAARTPNQIALIGKINSKSKIRNPKQIRNSNDQNSKPGGTGGLAPLSVHIAITYRELNRKSGQLSHLLRSKGVQPDTIVGLMVERSVEMIVGILGILEAGGAYMPIDPEYPGERINYMLADSSAKVLLAASQARVKAEVEKNFGQQFINMETGLTSTPGPSRSTLISTCQASPTNLAYVIYTSGSTGKPKGVLVEHSNVVPLVKNANFIHAGPGDSLLLTGALVFDITTFEIWYPLLNGLTLFLADQEVILKAEKLEEFIIKKNISILHLIPQLFNELAVQRLGIFKTLKYFLVGGDLVRPDYINPLRSIYKDLKILHMYGPTENTTFSTFFPVKKEYEHTIPIGKPTGNSRVYILDPYGLLQPIGVAGELCTGGAGVARGYLNQPELTFRKFVNYKLQTVAGEKFHMSYMSHMSHIYRTGDLARWLTDGNIEFLGRMDRQVKIRGFRIELGEIEDRLLSHGMGKEAIVIANKNEEGETYLTAFITAAEDKDFETVELRDYLSGVLPGYMIPVNFLRLEHVPLTATGKVDRQTLMKMGAARAAGSGIYIPPRGEIEKKLAVIWANILNVERVGIHDDFFNLGGHSLKALQLVNIIEKEFNVKINFQDVFNYPTVAGLGKIVEKGEKALPLEIEKLPLRDYYELSYSQNRLWVIYKLEPRSPAFNMAGSTTFTGEVDEDLIKKAAGVLVDRHDSFRTYFKEINGVPVQVVENLNRVNLESVDLSVLASEESLEVAARYRKNEQVSPFRLEQAPLVRLRLLKFHEGHYELFFAMHHIITDGWSLEILAEEFHLVYEAFKRGEKSPLPPLRIQYKDYAAWHNKLLVDEERKEKAVEFWENQLSGDLVKVELPYDDVIEGKNGESAGFRLVVPAGVTRRLRALARQQNASLFMVLLSAFYLLLWRLSGQKDIILAIPAAARQHEELKHIIGFFVNTLILRGRIEPKTGFVDFLKKVQANTLSALEHQSYPLEEVFKRLKIKYPEVPVFFNMSIFGDINRQYLENREAYHSEEVQDAKFDMVCYLKEYKNGIEIDAHYRKALFKPVTIEKILQKYTGILEAISFEPVQKLRGIHGSRQTQTIRPG
jgi:amino acid adenylation domain-containing protein